MLLDDVRAQAERMVQRTEIVRQANHVAQRILDDADEEAAATPPRVRGLLRPAAGHLRDRARADLEDRPGRAREAPGGPAPGP